MPRPPKMLMVLTIIGVWVSMIGTSAAVWCNRTDFSNFTIKLRNELTYPPDGSTLDADINSECVELTAESK